MTLEDRIAALEQANAALAQRVSELEKYVADRKQQYQSLLDKLREPVLLEQRVDRVTEHPETTVKWRDVRRTYTREQVIDMAKQDIQEWSDWLKNALMGLRFRINRQHRSVVAEKFDLVTGKKCAKGVAQCAPDDCFNVHIGKEIALRRALGLEVPDYYVNAPQPTEAQIGDVIRFDDDEDDFVVVDRLTDKTPFQYATNVRGKLNGFIVVDDSHDFGGEQP
jgi:uncharacterized coiled-coil protein SlyX